MNLFPLQDIVQSIRAMRITLRRLGTPPRRSEPVPFRGLPVMRTDEHGRTLCTGCGECVDACPTHCIVVTTEEGSVRHDLDWQRCLFCGTCVTVCPEQALAPVSEVPQPVFAARSRRRDDRVRGHGASSRGEEPTP